MFRLETKPKSDCVGHGGELRVDEEEEEEEEEEHTTHICQPVNF